MNAEPLLAKARPKSTASHPTEITLTGHTACVLAASATLFGDSDPSGLGRSWLHFFGLTEADFPCFRHHLRVAAAAHDWGKANRGFQDAVLKNGDQVIRHEHLSAMLLAELLAPTKARAWLQEAGIDLDVILAAVVSHHVKARRDLPLTPAEYTIGSLVTKRDSLDIETAHPDFAALWRQIQTEISSGSLCPVGLELIDRRWDKATIGVKSQKLKQLLDKARPRIAATSRWVAAVRAGLIVADAVGSAVVRIDRGDEASPERVIKDYATRCFGQSQPQLDVWSKVTLPRIEELRRKKRWRDDSGSEFRGVRGFSEFQCEVAEQGPRVLLSAPCGSGKTLAAWNWIQTQIDARPSDQSLTRVLFLYPTRATATEGFRDYVSWAPDDEAGLLSGTAAFDLQGLFGNPQEAPDERAGKKFQPDPRLFALGQWGKRVVSATADQFFPFMQYVYGPLCMLPVLAESILVVDEVHSFDRSMFNTLRRFLQEFPTVPVLCMTATLSAERRRDLTEGCGLIPYVHHEGTPEPGEVADSEYERYRIRWVDRDDARWLARGALGENKRVLWVSNRVDDCRETFGWFPNDDYGLADEATSFCYHSRFKLEDRRERHKALIAAFGNTTGSGGERAAFGATTQVCEMSLDLDADVLITELAPIAALIQRMGRCNRDSARLRRRPIGRVYVLRPDAGKEKPYDKEELELARTFVDRLDRRDVSQYQLDQLHQELDPGEVEPAKLCPFLDSGAYAYGKEESFRDADDFTVPAILKADESAVLLALKRKEPIDGFLVPVPRWLATMTTPETSALPRWLGVAETSRYCSLTGFDGRPRPEDNNA